MFEPEYRAQFDSINPSPALVEATKDRVRTASSNREKPRRHLTRRGLAALATAAVLTVTALAAGPTLWQAIQNDLGNRASYATQVKAACEDQGIRIEVLAALADTRVTRLYFTVQDRTGALLDADTTSDLILSQETGGQFGWGNGGKGLEVLSYDPEQHLATLVYSRGTADLAGTPPTRVRLDATYFIPGHRQAELVLDRDELPTETLESTVTNAGTTVLLSDQNPMVLGEDGDVSISSIGFASDGSFHIRFAQGEKVSPITDGECPFRVDYYLYNPENPERWPEQGVGDAICTAVEGGWDFCLPSLTPDTLEYLDLLCLSADYSVAGGRIEGNWAVTVPVEVMDLRTAAPAEPLVLPYTQNGEQPYGRTHDAQLHQFTVSPLSVCADFTTPEGQEAPCMLNGAELSLTVTMADGTVLAPAYYDEVWSQQAGWVMWEFEDPIDPDQVVSVTLNGQTIPLS